MNSSPIDAGKIIWLSGPSSSGKTTSTRLLEETGWLRIEADAERSEVEISLLKREFLTKFTYLESHFITPTTANIIGAICGGVKPDKMPIEPGEYEKVRLLLLGCLQTRCGEVSQALLVHMLDKAIDLALLGKNVILDHVPFINDPGFSSHKITLDGASKNLWCYRSFKIEQQLKYVPVETLMLNVIRRNHNPDDHRPMPMVLEQYAERFTTSTSLDEEQLGTLPIASLKKWVERAVKIDFFDISPNHGFKYDISKDGDLDLVIQKRLEEFSLEMGDPENAIDPTGEKADADDVKSLKQKKLEYPHLQEKIDQTIKKIMEAMKIPETATIVNLTYTSSSGVKPIIIKDS